MMLAVLDVILLSIISISTILGLWAGMVKSLTSTFSTVGAIFLAFLIYPTIADFFSDHISKVVFLEFIVAIFAYIISIIFCSILKSILNKILLIVSGGFFDRFFGFIFGFIRGVLITLILFFMLIIIVKGKYSDAESVQDLQLFEYSSEPEWVYNSMIFQYMHESNAMFKSKYPQFYEYLISQKLPSFSTQHNVNNSDNYWKQNKSDDSNINHMLKKLFDE